MKRTIVYLWIIIQGECTVIIPNYMAFKSELFWRNAMVYYYYRK